MHATTYAQRLRSLLPRNWHEVSYWLGGGAASLILLGMAERVAGRSFISGFWYFILISVGLLLVLIKHGTEQKIRVSPKLEIRELMSREWGEANQSDWHRVFRGNFQFKLWDIYRERSC